MLGPSRRLWMHVCKDASIGMWKGSQWMQCMQWPGSPIPTLSPPLKLRRLVPGPISAPVALQRVSSHYLLPLVLIATSQHSFLSRFAPALNCNTRYATFVCSRLPPPAFVITQHEDICSRCDRPHRERCGWSRAREACLAPYCLHQGQRSVESYTGLHRA